MLIGQFEYALDAKSRLFIPAKFRDHSGRSIKNQKFILTRGLEECLYLFLPSSWDKLLDRFEELGVSDKQQERAFKRIFFAGATEVVADKQGRILIPQNLGDYAGLKREAVINGAGNKIEIWSQEKWHTYYKRAASSFTRLVTKLEF